MAESFGYATRKTLTFGDKEILRKQSLSHTLPQTGYRRGCGLDRWSKMSRDITWFEGAGCGKQVSDLRVSLPHVQPSQIGSIHQGKFGLYIPV